jgi:hypothetical protein
LARSSRQPHHIHSVRGTHRWGPWRHRGGRHQRHPPFNSAAPTPGRILAGTRRSTTAGVTQATRVRLYIAARSPATTSIAVAGRVPAVASAAGCRGRRGPRREVFHANNVHRRLIIKQGNLVRNERVEWQEQVIIAIVEEERLGKPDLLRARDGGGTISPGSDPEAPHIFTARRHGAEALDPRRGAQDGLGSGHAPCHRWHADHF